MWNLLVLSALSISAVEVKVLTLAGDGLAGTLLEVTADSIVLQTPGGVQTLGFGDLLAVSRVDELSQAPQVPTTIIDLVDGSSLLATSYTVTGGKALTRLEGGGDVEIPTRSIRSALLSYSPEEDLQKQWEAIREEAATGDIIVIRKERTFTIGEGELAEERVSVALDYLEGVFNDVTPTTVQFAYNETPVNVSRARVQGLVYYHGAGRELREPLGQVTDIFGSQWNARSILSRDDRLELVSTAGVRYSMPLAHLRKLDFSMGKLVYLSDLKPEQVQWTPFFNSGQTPSWAKLFEPQMDRAFGGGELRLGRLEDGHDKTYDKGLAIHSRTFMMYHLPTGFDRFRAMAGIDNRVRNAGNIHLVISGDGRPLFEKTITGKDEPLPVDLSIRGIRRLSILVDYGDELDIADHLNLCDVKITK